ncbi:MAG: YihY/virulence factor BrkB family protein [Acidimicrobiia bacterium]
MSSWELDPMRLPQLLIIAGRDWLEDQAPRLAAALSYYTAFSLPPLLVLLVGIAGLVYDAEAVRGRIVDEIAALVGTESARLLGDAIAQAQLTTGAIGAVAIGIAVLLFGASGVFGQLQDALNTIWEVKPKSGGGFWKLARSRLLSVATVLGAGFLLLVSLTLSAGIGTLVEMAERFEALAPFLTAIDLIASMIVITVLFALIFKYLPDVKIAWTEVWMGAALTALLFVAGKFAIGFYLGASDIGSAYGAAGSLIVVLVWIYYSALILFFGAEFTQAFANNRRAHAGDAVASRQPDHHPLPPPPPTRAGAGPNRRD